MSSQSEQAKSKKSERTRMKILDAFLDLMKDKQWDRITVKELCARASITRGTFYQYFSDIYDLMESLENQLLEDLTARYAALYYPAYAAIPADRFVDRFDCRPPASFSVWFRFVRDYKKPLYALLDRSHGDKYFVRKLQQIMVTYINRSMDSDGLPSDALRSHFVKIMTEMHFLSAQSWIEGNETEELTEEEIVNLLNTMRVGGCYLGFKRRSDPDFDRKMADSQE